MAVAVKKRSLTTKNTLGFILFSFLYTYVIFSISLGETAISYNKLIDFINVNYLQVTLGLISFVWVYFFWKYMEYVFVAYCLVLNINVFYYFYDSFDKLILIFNFFFLITSYTFYLLLKAERDESVYEPRFKANYMGKKCEYEIPCKVTTYNYEGAGYLTNWDSNGVFVFFEDKDKLNLEGEVELEFSFGRNNFKDQGIIRTAYGNGFGISIKRSKDDLNWKKLYNVLSERGYKPRYS